MRRPRHPDPCHPGSGPTSPLVGQSLAIEGASSATTSSQRVRGLPRPGRVTPTRTPTPPRRKASLSSTTSARDVARGDHVRLRGTVAEFNGLTELNSVSLVIVCSTGNTVTPARVSPVASVADLERYEGSLVHVSQTMTATEVFNLGRFGEVSLSGTGRLYTRPLSRRRVPRRRPGSISTTAAGSSSTTGTACRTSTRRGIPPAACRRATRCGSATRCPA